MTRSPGFFVFRNFFTFQKEDSPKVFLLLGMFFITTYSFIIGRMASDALYLNKTNAKTLSYIYLIIAVLLALTGLVYRQISVRLKSDTLVYFNTVFFIFLAAVIRLFLYSKADWVYPFLFIIVEVINLILINQFWTLSNSVLDTAQAKRLLGIIGSGGTLGGIAGAYSGRFLVKHLGADNLIFLYAVSMFGIIILTAFISATQKDVLKINHRETSSARSSKVKSNGRKDSSQNLAHLRLVSFIVVIITITTMIIDYQFKLVIKERYSPNEMALFLGEFYGFAGIIGLVFQLFLSAKILARFGILVALILLPIALFISSGIIFASPWLSTALVLKVGIAGVLPLFWGVVMAKGADRIFSDTIYSAASQLMYIPFAPPVRNRAKIFVDGIVKPLSKGAGGILIIVLVSVFSFSTSLLSSVTITLLLPGIVAVILLRKKYLESLMDSLDKNSFSLFHIELNFADNDAVEILKKGLAAQDDRDVIYCLRVLKNIPGFSPDSIVESMLEHPSANVRREALVLYDGNVPANLKEKISSMVSDSADIVRIQAILTLASSEDEERLLFFVDLLQDLNLTVRAASILALIRHYGIDGIFYAVEPFREMLDSDSVPERSEAAGILGRCGIKTFYRPLIRLLQDPEIAVRRTAIQAASEICVIELIPPLMENLAQKELRSETIRSLSYFKEEDLLPFLKNALHDQGSFSEFSLSIPRIFAEAFSPGRMLLLLENYSGHSHHMRSLIWRAFHYARERHGELPIDKNQIWNILDVELDEYNDFSGVIHVFEGKKDFDDLEKSLRQGQRHIFGRISRILGLIYKAETVSTIFTNLLSQETKIRANALEALGHLLERRKRQRVLPVLENLVSGSGSQQRQKKNLVDVFRWMFAVKYRWLQIHAAFYSEIKGQKVFSKEELKRVEKYFVAAKVNKSKKELRTVFNNIETLQKISLFEGLPSEYLLPFSEKLKTVSYKTGKRIFTEGDKGDALYAIIKGKVKIHIGRKSIGVLGQGDYFGEVSLLSDEKRNASATAAGNTVVLKMDQGEFYEALTEREEIARSIIKVLLKRHRELLAQLDEKDASGKKAATAGKTVHSELVKQGSGHGQKMRKSNGINSIEDEITISDQKVLIQRFLALKKVDLFQRLDDKDLTKIAGLMQEEMFPEGSCICREGEQGSDLYIIGNGSVLVQKGVTTIARLSANDYFGEMSLLDSEPRSATVVAFEDTIAWKLGSDALYMIIEDNPAIMYSLCSTLSTRLKKADELLK